MTEADAINALAAKLTSITSRKNISYRSYAVNLGPGMMQQILNRDLGRVALVTFVDNKARILLGETNPRVIPIQTSLLPQAFGVPVQLFAWRVAPVNAISVLNNSPVTITGVIIAGFTHP